MSVMVLMGMIIPTSYATAQTSTQGIAQLDTETRREFDRHLGDAQRAFSRERYEDAITSLKRAYALYPHPRIFYKLGQAHEELGADRMAKEAYETYLLSEDPDMDPDTIKPIIARLDARINRPSLLTLKTTPPGATVYIDEQAVATGTTPLYHDLPPGKHTLRIELDGHESRVIELTAGSGNILELEPTLTPRTMSLQEPFSDLDSGQRLPSARRTGLISLSTGTMGGVAFLIARQRAASTDDALAKRTTTPRPDDLERTQRQHNRLVAAGWGLMGLSAVSGSMSLLRWNQDRAQLSAASSPTSHMLSLEVSF